MCAKFYPDRLRFGSMRAKNLFVSKNSMANNVPMLRLSRQKIATDHKNEFI